MELYDYRKKIQEFFGRDWNKNDFKIVSRENGHRVSTTNRKKIYYLDFNNNLPYKGSRFRGSINTQSEFTDKKSCENLLKNILNMEV